jgi:putative ATP-dependent endonuclease of OLD family
MDIDLGLTNLLIGQNNTGKSNFLRAINVALGAMADVSEADIFVADGERLAKNKSAIIDVMLRPNDAGGKISENFSEFWTDVFTESWVTTSADEGAFVGIRTEIKLDTAKDSYTINRKCIRQWKESIDSAQLDAKKVPFTEDMRLYISSFYMDANRDIVQDLRNRKSFFGRVTSGYDMSDEKVKEIETQLSSVNATIVESIPSLQQTKERIAAIGRTIGSASSNVEIEPLTRKLSDLNRGMDIVMQDGGAIFSISQNGYGTRSWISFLTLSAFVENKSEKLKSEDDEAEQYIMLTMEEPEAHLHPQAQRQLFSQIQSFMGQKVISTHAPSVVAQSMLADAIYFCKKCGKTTAKKYKNIEAGLSNEDELILREVINTRADILFSSAVVLCEGITEELALPVYFNEYFGYAPFSLGVSIISTGGQKYQPYLALIKDFDIPWFIFSDGESEAISTVSAAINTVFGVEYSTSPNVITLSDGDEYETYLIHEGYQNEIVEAICEYEDVENYVDSYMSRMQGQNRKKKTAKKLNISITRDYTIKSGYNDALIDLCLEKKTEYALPVAKKIVANIDADKRIPSKVTELFDKLAAKLGIQKAAQSEGER